MTLVQAGPSPHPVVVCLVPGAVGLHVGLLLTVVGEPARFVHLAWHLQLRVDAAPDDGRWVAPTFTRAAAVTARKRALRVVDAASRNQVPYALDSMGITFLSDGAVDLGARNGLTCASFVAVLFESVGYPLVDAPTWSQRSADREASDAAAQARLVQHLRRDFPAHADRVAAEVGCTRLRPEEIAAASGLLPHPIGFAQASVAGEVLARAMR